VVIEGDGGEGLRGGYNSEVQGDLKGQKQDGNNILGG
jgi:hypothetical protein